jgi:hypothetical protein
VRMHAVAMERSAKRMMLTTLLRGNSLLPVSKISCAAQPHSGPRHPEDTCNVCAASIMGNRGCDKLQGRGACLHCAACVNQWPQHMTCHSKLKPRMQNITAPRFAIPAGTTAVH